MSDLSLRIDALAAVVQPTKGTFVAPDPTQDAIQTVDTIWPQITIENRFPNMRDQDANQSRVPGAPAPKTGRVATFNLIWRVKGTGSAPNGTPQNGIEITPILLAAGWNSVADATSQTLTLRETGNDGLVSIRAWAGGMRYDFRDVRGTWDWGLTPGDLQTWDLPLNGIVDSEPLEEATPAATYHATVPPPAVGMALTLDDPGAGTPFAPIWDAANISQGAAVNETLSGNAPDGVEDYTIAEMLPEGSVTMRRPSLTVFNAHKRARDEAETELLLQLGAGGADLNTFNLTATCYLGDPGQVDQNSLAAYTQPFSIRKKDAASPALTLVLT